MDDEAAEGESVGDTCPSCGMDTSAMSYCPAGNGSCPMGKATHHPEATAPVGLPQALSLLGDGGGDLSTGL